MTPAANSGAQSDAVLVTGGCGFVGRHLISALAGDAEEIWVVDDLSTGLHPDSWAQEVLPDPIRVDLPDRLEYRSATQRIVFILRDALTVLLPDNEVLRRAWPRFGDVYHLASIVGGRRVIEGQPLEVGLDLAIDSFMFRWLSRDSGVERLLYASSSAAYPVDMQGEGTAEALREEVIDFGARRVSMPDLSYGWSKLTGEYLAHLLSTNHGVATACVRPFSGYGEDQDVVYPVPAIAARAARRENPLVVWGTGHQSRDFVHIDDCIVAMRSAIQRISDGSAVNIGTGVATTFLHVAALLACAAEYEPAIRGTEEGPVGVHARFADVSKAQTVLGWRPQISLEDGLRRVLEAQAAVTR